MLFLWVRTSDKLSDLGGLNCRAKPSLYLKLQVPWFLKTLKTTCQMTESYQKLNLICPFRFLIIFLSYVPIFSCLLLKLVNMRKWTPYFCWYIFPLCTNTNPIFMFLLFQACICTDNVRAGDQQEDGQFQACITTANVNTGAKLEENPFQACFYTPNVDTLAEQEDKPGECKLEVNKSDIN